MDPIYIYPSTQELGPPEIPTVSLFLKVPPLLLFLYVLMRAASVTEKAYPWDTTYPPGFWSPQMVIV